MNKQYYSNYFVYDTKFSHKRSTWQSPCDFLSKSSIENIGKWRVHVVRLKYPYVDAKYEHIFGSNSKACVWINRAACT